MGLFNPIKKGTYNVVAENIALINYAIKTNPSTAKLTVDQQLFATVLFDTVAYDFDLGQLMNAVVCAHIQQISIFLSSKKYGKNYTSDEHELLVGLTMQTLAMIYEIDFPTLSPEYILNDIVKRKTLIESAIRKTQYLGANHPLFERMLFNITNSLREPQIRELINNFSLNP